MSGPFFVPKFSEINKSFVRTYIDIKSISFCILKTFHILYLLEIISYRGSNGR